MDISDVNDSKLSLYQGTIVKVLPNDDYLKKYWNKKHYLERVHNDTFYLKESYDGIRGWYGSVFCSNAIEHIHFEYIENSIIYDNNGNIVN